MNRFISSRAFVALLLASALVLGSVPAYGVSFPAVVHVEAVPSHALVAGRDLVGMTDADARAAITTGVVLPAFAPITLKGDGHSMTRDGAWIASVVAVDVDTMLQQAYDATDTVTPFELTPVYTVDATAVSAVSATLAKKVNHKAVNAKRRVKHGTALVVSKEKVGHSVNKVATANRLTAAIRSELTSSAPVTATVAASIKTLKPKITRKNIGKAIIVVLHHFRIKLYKGTKVEKTYRCATGTPAHPTPRGKFKITGKVKWPSWHNPGSAWARNMPSVIGPSVNNPLGTRAIYTSASGIRMHGVPSSEDWSIGHRASHGCLRMHRHDVEDLYPRVPVGIPVWIVK
jgi:lipoprotein-anchoring transpeptidase ErfK/SrfK